MRRSTQSSTCGAGLFSTCGTGLRLRRGSKGAAGSPAAFRRAARCALSLLLGLIGTLVAPTRLHAQTAAQPMLAPPPASAQTESPHALALRARWVTLPGWALSPYLAAHTELNDGWGVGLEYLYRHSGFDVVVSLDYSSLQARDGNYLGATNNPATETHFVHFDKLSSLSIDVSLIGHWNLTSWMEFRFGAGLGAGYVFGEIYQITGNSAGCTADSAGDPSKCFPSKIGPITNSNPETISQLESMRCSPDFTDGGRDTPQSPCYRRTDVYPFNVRIVPVLNVLLGVRFKLYRHVYLHLDGGFRLAGFYAGGGPEFRF